MPIINTVIQGGGTPAPSGKYQLFQRVTDDNNTEIGTVVGFHYDANDVEYAVVCLDAVYRLLTGQVLSSQISVSGLTSYGDQSVYGSKETATSNCDKILAQAATSSLTSTAVSHCRSNTFTIGGYSYAGQLPILSELVKIFELREAVNSIDPTATTYSTLIVPVNKATWCSNQKSTWDFWYISSAGEIKGTGKNSDFFVLPILEIPNAA